MALTFIKNERATGVAKMVSHRAGTMRLTLEASRLLNLPTGANLAFARLSNTELAMVPIKNNSECAFPLRKSGKYQYINGSALLRTLGYDTRKEFVTFNIGERIEGIDGKPYRITITTEER